MSAELIIKRTSSEDFHFIDLVKLLDADLAIRDGDDHDFYQQFNKIDMLRHCVVCYSEEKPIGCGAFKQLAEDTAEIKRMYTLIDFRGSGIATKILSALESWAIELGIAKCVLETGKKQPEAIALYKKNGYAQISNYGQYIGIENSLCFLKLLK